MRGGEGASPTSSLFTAETAPCSCRERPCIDPTQRGIADPRGRPPTLPDGSLCMNTSLANLARVWVAMSPGNLRSASICVVIDLRSRLSRLISAPLHTPILRPRHTHILVSVASPPGRCPWCLLVLRGRLRKPATTREGPWFEVSKL